MGGIDLRCGAGRVAALTCPRHVIHYRSRSIPDPKPYKKTTHTGGLFIWWRWGESNPRPKAL